MLRVAAFTFVLTACLVGEDPVDHPPLSSHRAIAAMSDEQIVDTAYQVILGRAADPLGMDGNVGYLQGGGTYDGVIGGLLGSPEFQGRPDLHDPTGFITRLYRVILEREPDPGGLATWVGVTATDYSNWAAIFAGFANAPEYTSVRRPIAGVHYPIPIWPRIDLTDAAFVRHMYETLLGREPDPGGFAFQIRVARAYGRDAVFHGMVGSPELLDNSALRDRAGFVSRLYSSVLGRAAAPSEIAAWASSLGDPDGAGNAPNWLETYRAFLVSDEYRGHACVSSYYTYDEPIARSSPILEDVLTGRARMQNLAEAAHVDDGRQQDASKLAWFRDHATGTYYAFSRVYTNGRFNIRLFRETSDNPPAIVPASGDIFDPADYAGYAGNMLDPQLSIDNSVCPRRYILTMECDGNMCNSYSTTPLEPASWSPPVRVLASTQYPFRSASVGRIVFDHKRSYLSWTEVYDGATPQLVNNERFDDGNEYGLTSAIYLDNPYDRATLSVADFGSPTILGAPSNTQCSGWNCGLVDGQDWRKEGAYYYMLYNGADYYTCHRPPGDGGDNTWGIAIARSNDATFGYGQTSPPILGDNHDVCDLSYPMVHAQNGRLVVTFASQEGAAPYQPYDRWAELVWQ